MKRGWPAALPLAILAAVGGLAFVCGRPSGGGGSGAAAAAAGLALAQGFKLDDAAAKADLAELTLEPHPFGSVRQAQVLEWLTGRLRGGGGAVAREAFTATVPNPAALDPAAGPVPVTLTRAGANLYALPPNGPKAPCAVALATHVDTKVVEGLAYVGANDSGSSTAVLLQQLKFLQAPRGAALRCGIIGVFFDGEEAVLRDWSDGERRHPARLRDNTYGSRYAAGRLAPCQLDGRPARCLPAELGGQPLVAVILMDMIGPAELHLSRDANSAPALVELAAAGAAALGAAGLYDPVARGIEDDHLPFKEQGVPVLDLIDFNHLDYWHRAGDEPATLSMASLSLAGKLALYVAGAVAADPDQQLAAGP